MCRLFAQIEITPGEFKKFRDYIYKNVGIALTDQKEALVRGRLSKRVQQLNLRNFTQYYDFLVQDESGDETTFFINAISTNVTSFFRSPPQWEYLKGHIQTLEESKKSKKLRIWSAACSSGEEPYTIIIFLMQTLKDFHNWDIKILATDISKKVLTKAIEGEYRQKDVTGLTKYQLTTFFDQVRSGSEISYKVKDELKSYIVFRTFNLVTDHFFFNNKFDIIFCRNVMIYFDEQTRRTLIANFAKLLEKSSLLLLGDSEALTDNRSSFSLERSSIYKKI